MTQNDYGRERFDARFTALEWGVFEQAIENQMHIIDDTEQETPTPEIDASQRTILADLLDRAQRTRNASGGPPVTFEFDAAAELAVAIGALAAQYEMTRRVGVADGFDKEEVQQTTIELATRLDEKHPDESVIDGLEIEFPHDNE